MAKTSVVKHHDIDAGPRKGARNGGHVGVEFVGGSRTWSFRDQVALAEWLFQTYSAREQHLQNFPTAPISTARAAMSVGVPREYIDAVVVMIESGLIDLVALAERFSVRAEPRI